MSEIDLPNEEKQVIDLEEEDNDDDLGSEGSRFSEDFHSNEGDAEHKIDLVEGEGNMEIEEIPQVKNPVSSYMMFVKGWKENHPGEKLNISMMGDIWKELSEEEKSIYENKFRQEKAKYDEYVAKMLAKDPNFMKRGQSSSKKCLFPLHRVKNIMKQDSQFATSAENVLAMTHAVQYFGQYFLEEMKKITEGKKRIDVNDFFTTINNNQSNLWFLNCLIDEHNDETDKNKKQNTETKEQKSQKKAEVDEDDQKEKEEAKKKRGPIGGGGRKKKQVISKGQMKLTDMF